MKRIHALTAMAVSLVLSTGAMAQVTDQVTGQMSATVLAQDITLTQVETLRFGTLLPFGRAGTIRIHTNGVTQGVNALSTADGGPSLWTVEGIGSAPYNVALPASAAVTDAAGNNMTVNTFSRSGGSQLVLDAAGDASFAVGAYLQVGANQPAGNYNGTYQVTVSYN
ncbi:MAG: DUF4402 domain-containing protein [Arenicella sp.]|nr:DUF4402 domain-containing protein [Arenicella sp.]